MPPSGVSSTCNFRCSNFQFQLWFVLNLKYCMYVHVRKVFEEIKLAQSHINLKNLTLGEIFSLQLEHWTERDTVYKTCDKRKSVELNYNAWQVQFLPSEPINSGLNFLLALRLLPVLLLKVRVQSVGPLADSSDVQSEKVRLFRSGTKNKSKISLKSSEHMLYYIRDWVRAR